MWKLLGKWKHDNLLWYTAQSFKNRHLVYWEHFFSILQQQEPGDEAIRQPLHQNISLAGSSLYDRRKNQHFSANYENDKVHKVTRFLQYFDLMINFYLGRSHCNGHMTLLERCILVEKSRRRQRNIDVISTFFYKRSISINQRCFHVQVDSIPQRCFDVVKVLTFVTGWKYKLNRRYFYNIEISTTLKS